jgi:Carboxypeptidase regulatory-like domain
MVQSAFYGLREFRNYRGRIKIARCGFPWKKTARRPVASVYTNCETALPAPRNGLQWRRLQLRARRGPRRHTLCVLFCCLPFLTQAQQIKSIDTPLPDAPTTAVSAAQDAGGQNPAESLGTISGTVVDQNGNFVFSARVRLEREGHIEEREAASDKEGHFTFAGVPAGPFRLTISAVTFADQEVAGILHPGEALEVPLISLPIAAATTEVRVSVTNYELAEEQVKIEETQRVLGVIPNFYVSYQQDTLPLRICRSAAGREHIQRLWTRSARLRQALRRLLCR